MLETVEKEFRGFSYEGAAMGLALFDAGRVSPRRRLEEFIAGPAARHTYMAHVGAGWAMARLPRPLRGRIRPADPLLAWLALDGYGFHEAYFNTATVVTGRRRPRIPLSWPGSGRDVAAVIDQGVGRALWFVCGADVEHLATTIGGFAPDRRADLWAGTGLAATYAGGVGETGLHRLAELSGRYRPELAQGSAFAAKARLRADLVTSHTALAVRALCGLTVEEAARRTDDALPDPAMPGAYQTWRQAIRTGLSTVGNPR